MYFKIQGLVFRVQMEAAKDCNEITCGCRLGNLSINHVSEC